MQAAINVDPIKEYNADLTLVGDKSITHRAIMFNGLAEGEASVYGGLLGEDCLSTIDCMRKLGASVAIEQDRIRVVGRGKPRDCKLYVGNSGTTIRLLSGFLAGRGINVELTGDASICRRPLKRVIEPLTMMGASIVSANGFAPISFYPSALAKIDYTLPVYSAQVKSAILLAGLSASGETIVRERVQTRNHTELMLSAMGADLRCEGLDVFVRRSELCATNVSVPVDISSAAYFLVLASCMAKSRVVLRNVGVNPTRTGILDVLTAAGGDFTLFNNRVECGEMVADIEVRSCVPKPFVVEGDIIPRLIDEIPVLCVLAAMCKGDSVIRNAEELRVKETDRIATMVAALKALSVDVEATADGMIVHGTGSILGGAEVDSATDHRVALSMYIAGLLSVKGCRVKGFECANVSFPDFLQCFDGV